MRSLFGVATLRDQITVSQRDQQLVLGFQFPGMRWIRRRVPTIMHNGRLWRKLSCLGCAPGDGNVLNMGQCLRKSPLGTIK
jgi:hypothetical protein